MVSKVCQKVIKDVINKNKSNDIEVIMKDIA